MSKVRLGCETYTWQMPGEQYKGRLEHIMEVCAKAGFNGIEPETSFLQHLEDPILMKDALEESGLELAVLCVVEDWLHPKETEEEHRRAQQWIEFLGHFPETILLLVQMPQQDRTNLAERQQNCIDCCNAFARRAAEKNIIVSKHPNSPSGSVFRTAADYEVLIDGLDQQAIGYCPDLGHIAKGDMDPMEVIKQYREWVNLVHYKDIYSDGRWAPTGDGEIDFVEITRYLVDSGYEGWIIMEDECDRAITDPDGLTLDDGQYIDRHLRPLL
ncbi:MAG: sugar phosphate isomerase/epimerase [Saprospiraceae bacterium]|nr:sugar phosphate isomerase/epimerase [Saprospiraceae bacterium]